MSLRDHLQSTGTKQNVIAIVLVLCGVGIFAAGLVQDVGRNPVAVALVTLGVGVFLLGVLLPILASGSTIKLPGGIEIVIKEVIDEVQSEGLRRGLTRDQALAAIREAFDVLSEGGAEQPVAVAAPKGAAARAVASDAVAKVTGWASATVIRKDADPNNMDSGRIITEWADGTLHVSEVLPPQADLMAALNQTVANVVEGSPIVRVHALRGFEQVAHRDLS